MPAPKSPSRSAATHGSVPEGEIGDRIINLEDIKEDAKKVRLYDNVYDMYYDEFEDADENEREAVVS